jgi:hypothetical protein
MDQSLMDSSNFVEGKILKQKNNLENQESINRAYIIKTYLNLKIDYSPKTPVRYRIRIIKIGRNKITTTKALNMQIYLQNEITSFYNIMI